MCLTGIDVFCLDSVSLPRQYFTLFVLDLPVSLMTSDLIVVSPWRDFFQGQVNLPLNKTSYEYPGINLLV